MRRIKTTQAQGLLLNKFTLFILKFLFNCFQILAGINQLSEGEFYLTKFNSTVGNKPRGSFQCGLGQYGTLNLREGDSTGTFPVCIRGLACDKICGHSDIRKWMGEVKTESTQIMESKSHSEYQSSSPWRKGPYCLNQNSMSPNSVSVLPERYGPCGPRSPGFLWNKGNNALSAERGSLHLRAEVACQH